jgi:hypothetical protein
MGQAQHSHFLSLLRLSLKIRTPYEQLSTYTTQFKNLQTTCELLRRLHRFIILSRRLDVSSSTDRDLASSATTLYKLGLIMDESDFEGIDLVAKDLPMIQQCRTHVLKEGDRLLQEGI